MTWAVLDAGVAPFAVVSLGENTVEAARQAAIATAAAASVSGVVAPYGVAWKGEARLDVTGATLYLPDLMVQHNGSTSAMQVNAATFGLTEFSVPTSVSSNSNVYVYLDIAAVNTPVAGVSPIKTVLAASVPAVSSNVVYLGSMSSKNISFPGLTLLRSDRREIPSRMALKEEILFDRSGVIAGDGVTAVYLPTQLVMQRLGGVGSALTVTNAASSEIRNYVKFTPTFGSNNFSTIYYDPDANAYAIKSATVAAITNSARSSFVSVMEIYWNSWGSSFAVRDINQTTTGDNQFLYGANAYLAPQKTQSDTTAAPLSAIDATTQAFLSGLGLANGVKRPAPGSLSVGDTISEVVPRGRFFARVYVYSPDGVTWPGAVSVFLRNSAGLVQTVAMSRVRDVTTNLRQYEANALFPVSNLPTLFVIGHNGAAGDLSYWGHQFHASNRGVLDIYRAHYPTASAAAATAQSTVTRQPRLVRFDAKRQAIKNGEAYRLTLAMLGDSWTYRSGSTYRVVDRLRAELGNAGAGTIAFWADGGVNIVPAAESRTGELRFTVSTRRDDASAAAWTVTDNTPGIFNVQGASSTVGDQVRVAVASTGTTQTAVSLLYRPVVGSAIRWRKNSGAWTALSTATAGGIAPLTGLTLADGDTLDLEVTAGTPILEGLFATASATGFLPVKLAEPGSRSDHWANNFADATAQSQLAAMDIDTLMVSLGTNDQAVSATVTPDLFKTNLVSIATNMRVAEPWTNEPAVDFAVLMPCENWAGRSVAMSQYQDRGRAAAEQMGGRYTAIDPVAVGWSDGSLHLSNLGYGAMVQAALSLLLGEQIQ